MMITTKSTCYNGIMWHTVLFPDGARAVWPSRLDGRRIPGAATRYYRKSRKPAARVARSQPLLALSHA